MSTPFDPYHKWLGIAPKDQPPNHYRLLGVDLFEDDREVIDAAANRILSYLKELAVGDDEAHSQRIMNEVMQARLCLLKPKRKAAYDAELRAKQVPKKPPSRSKEEEPVAQAMTAQPSTSSIPAITTSPKPVDRTLSKSRNSSRSVPLAVIGGSVASLAAVLLLVFLFVANRDRRDNATPANTEPNASGGSDTKSTDAQPLTEVVKAASPDKETSHDGQTPRSDKDDRPARVVPGGDSTSESFDPLEPEHAIQQSSANKTATPADAVRSRADEPTILPTPVPLPLVDAARDARRQVDEAYRSELNGATTVEQQVAIARRMFQAANDASEKSDKRFALLIEAQTLAIAAGDAAFANEVMDRLARDFIVEGVASDASVWDAKVAVLQELSRRAATARELATVAEAALATADLAARGGQIDLAKSIVALAVGEARKASNVEQFRKATLRLLDLQEGKIAESEPEMSTPSVTSTSPSVPPLAIAPFDEAAAKQHQKAWAKYLNVPVEMTNSIGMRFQLIPPGEFDMGTTESEVARLLEHFNTNYPSDWIVRRLPTEAPRHRVRITKPFYLGVSEVTQAEYERVMATNPSQHDSDPTHPVEMVSWDDASAFFRKLAQLPQEQAAGLEYRLPTEAEWEYACRAGTTTTWCSGDDEAALANHGWYCTNSAMMTHTVCQKVPNAWGLYDMHGNVWEWCHDWSGDRYYAKSPLENPTGPLVGTMKVRRSGSFGGVAYECRSSSRNWADRGKGDPFQGFRIARSVSAAVNEAPSPTLGGRESPLMRERVSPALGVPPSTAVPIPTANDALAEPDGAHAEFGRTDAAGGRDRNSFEDLAPPGHLLVGLNVSEGDFQGYHVIWSVQAVYASSNGKVIESKTYGTPGDKMTKLIARPGYAVGGLLIKSGLLIDRFQVIFMRIGSDELIPDDTYNSEWVGGPGGKNQQTLGGDGKPIIGIYGDYRKIVPRLGLIQGP